MIASQMRDLNNHSHLYKKCSCHAGRQRDWQRDESTNARYKTNPARLDGGISNGLTDFPPGICLIDWWPLGIHRGNSETTVNDLVVDPLQPTHQLRSGARLRNDLGPVHIVRH